MQLLRAGKSFSGRERNCAFLNTGGQFANVSSPTGLDYPDDGRAVAMVDWDHDGDLDIWIHNRTSPRLRFMRNQLVSHDSDSTNAIAIRLIGTRSNRDAIGATAQVNIDARPDDSGPRRLIQTVTAGDGYLAQSSKWLHFGLGSAKKVASIEVRWPSGGRETYPAVPANGRFRLVEGTGKAKQLTAKRTDLAIKPQPQLVQDSSNAIRIRFANPVPLPLLPMRDQRDGPIEFVTAAECNLLVVLWASWCPNCLEELSRLQAMEAALQDAKIDVLALNIDALAVEQGPNMRSAESVLDRIGFTHATGFATAALMDKFSLVQRIVLNRPLESAVPTMLLVNPNNELVGLFQGVHPVEDLIKDTHSSQDAGHRRDRSIPFAGRWTTPPRILLLRPVANVFAERGYDEDFQRYLELDRQRITRLLAEASSVEDRQTLEARFANDTFDLALLLTNSGRATEAVEYYKAGLAIYPSSSKGRYEYGRALASLGNHKAAIEQFQAAVELDPENFHAQFQLGIAAARERQLDIAVRSFLSVTEQQPSHVEAWTNLGMVLAQLKRRDEAIEALKTATQLDPKNGEAMLALGGQLASQQRYAEASHCFRAATELDASQPRAFAAFGQCLVKLNQDASALSALRRALELNPEDAASRLQIAWIQSTSSDQQLRSGSEALQTAIELANRTRNRDPQVLDVLAAASAEVGNFQQAVKAATAAQSSLPPGHPLRARIQGRLDAYLKSKPYRR